MQHSVQATNMTNNKRFVWSALGCQSRYSYNHGRAYKYMTT
ncbi:hypothetical protein HMPREF3232_00808 [Fannyhessea vaginae]|nr:hypothetical protein HMPREF3232_00808 [Fannyhessea vaginae]